jgi:ABC-type transporter Mla subunit MlaD
MSTRQIEVAEAKVTIEGINVGVVAAVHNGDNNTTHSKY